MHRLTASDAVTAWADGWAWSRHAGRPERVDAMWRVQVGAERESVRWLLPDPTPDLLAALLSRPHPAHTAVKLVADPAEWEPRFADGWQADIPVWLMWSPLVRRRVPMVPDGYVLEREDEEHVVVVRVLAPNGDLAARGRAGLGDYAVPDQIVTEPAHRRLGLGTGVMTALTHAALESGRTRAVLGASVAGRALYRSLGWQEVGQRTGMYYRPDDVA